jgi:hypothetical protein
VRSPFVTCLSAWPLFVFGCGGLASTRLAAGSGDSGSSSGNAIDASGAADAGAVDVASGSFGWDSTIASDTSTVIVGDTVANDAYPEAVAIGEDARGTQDAAVQSSDGPSGSGTRCMSPVLDGRRGVTQAAGRGRSVSA